MAKKKKPISRPIKGRMIAGVCLAFSDYLNVDVAIIRIIWAFLLVPGGIPGLLPYLICWFLIPSRD